MQSMLIDIIVETITSYCFAHEYKCRTWRWEKMICLIKCCGNTNNWRLFRVLSPPVVRLLWFSRGFDFVSFSLPPRKAPQLFSFLVKIGTRFALRSWIALYSHESPQTAFSALPEGLHTVHCELQCNSRGSEVSICVVHFLQI